MKPKISSLQAELKALQKQHEKQRSELESFVSARRKIKIEVLNYYAQSTAFAEFFQYYDCTTTIALQRALGNEVPKWDPEEDDWQLPIIIEQFHHDKVCPLFASEKILC